MPVEYRDGQVIVRRRGEKGSPGESFTFPGHHFHLKQNNVENLNLKHALETVGLHLLALYKGTVSSKGNKIVGVKLNYISFSFVLESEPEEEKEERVQT